MSGNVRVVAFMRAKLGPKDLIPSAVIKCLGPSRRETGCLSYDAYSDRHDAAMAVVIEHWASREQRERHLQSAHFIRLAQVVDGENRLADHVVCVLDPLSEVRQ